MGRLLNDWQGMRTMADEGSGPVVLINTFSVMPGDQERLIALLAQITRESVVTAPGFLSATLHRSVDGRKVTMYALWRSAQDYAAMRQSGQSRGALDAISAIATFEPGIYEIVEEFRPTGVQADPASRF